MGEQMIDCTLQEMYDNYYTANFFKKREITAIQTINHIRLLWGESSHPKRVLDVGAGEGSLLNEMSKAGFGEALYGVEISNSGITMINEKEIENLVEIKKFNGYKIPYPDNFFDLAVSIHVLEHVEHERIFLKEISRVAKQVLIEVLLGLTLNVNRAIRISRHYGHINFYNPITLLNLLETSGLKIKNYKIFSSSKELECLNSNSLMAVLKFFLRRYSLSFFPKFAPFFMTYLCMAKCTKAEVE